MIKSEMTKNLAAPMINTMTIKGVTEYSGGLLKERELYKKSRKKIYYLLTEGEITEESYLNQLSCLLDRKKEKFEIQYAETKSNSDPQSAVKKVVRANGFSIANKCAGEGLDCEIWLVYDLDHRNEATFKFDKITRKKMGKFKLVISNPMFEYWLLLHYEDGHKISSAKNIKIKLKDHLPDYKKTFPSDKLKLSHVKNAMERARNIYRKIESVNKFNKIIYYTEVFRLVESLFGAAGKKTNK